MARLPRFAIPDQPQHVIVRGNNRSEIFCADAGSIESDPIDSAMTDALFGKAGLMRSVPVSRPTAEEEIAACLALARSLGAKIKGLRNCMPGNGMPGHLSDDLQSAENFAGGAVRKLQAAADGLADGAPEMEPACHCGECDGCVAARSDEHYDRRRDGGL